MTTKLQVQPYPVVSNDNLLWCITVDALIILIIIWALGEPRNSTLKHFSLHVYHAPLLLITASYNIYFCIYRKRAMDRSSNNFKIVPLTTYFFILQANNIKVQRRLKNFPLETSRPFWQISQPSTLWRFQCFRSMASSRFHFHSTLLEKEMDNELTIYLLIRSCSTFSLESTPKWPRRSANWGSSKFTTRSTPN